MNKTTIRFWITLAVIVVAGGWLRFTHLGWDDYQQLHPDERAIWYTVQRVNPPDLPISLLPETTASLNPLRLPDGQPQYFAYGHLPVYAAAALTPLIQGAWHLPYPTAALLSMRVWSALADTVTILVTALLARRLFNSMAGIAASAAVTFTVLHIQNAHFGTVDTSLTVFATLTVYTMISHIEHPDVRTAAATGLCFGLSVSCKASGVLLIGPFLIAHLNVSDRKLRIRQPAHFVNSILAACASFVVTSPYALLDAPVYLRNISTQAAMIGGLTNWPFTLQYTDAVPLLYTAGQLACWGSGLPLTVVGYAGTFWAGWQGLKKGRRDLLITAVWIALIFLTVSLGAVRFPRYVLPAVPAMFALGAGMLTTGGMKKWSWIRWAVSATVLLSGVIWALAFNSAYSQPHPQITASRWIYDNVPQGTALSAELWDDALPLDLPGYLREAQFNTVVLDPFTLPDDETKLDTLLESTAETDYIVLASRRAWGTIPRFPERYPLTGAYYRALFKGDLGFDLILWSGRNPQIGPITIVNDPFSHAELTDPRLHYLPEGTIFISAGWLDESLTIYDQPLVLIFANQAHLSPEQMKGIVLDEVHK